MHRRTNAHGNTRAIKSSNRLAVRLIAASHDCAAAREHQREAAHAATADADEVHVLAAEINRLARHAAYAPVWAGVLVGVGCGEGGRHCDRAPCDEGRSVKLVARP